MIEGLLATDGLSEAPATPNIMSHYEKAVEILNMVDSLKDSSQYAQVFRRWRTEFHGYVKATFTLMCSSIYLEPATKEQEQSYLSDKQAEAIATKAGRLRLLREALPMLRFEDEEGAPRPKDILCASWIAMRCLHARPLQPMHLAIVRERYQSSSLRQRQA